MKFPSADRYNEAIQNPAIYFVDQEVKRRRVQTDALGLPEVLSGGFAFTYRFTGSGNDVAVRCFHREIPELFERYRSISAFLASLNSRFFVEFAFTERGVAIDGSHLPVVRMQWVEGETLLGYVARHRSEPAALENLRRQLLAFAEESEARSYAHGDVQHRNLMVATNGELKLVDYDGMYVPTLRHLRAADAGHPHFQPPSRASNDFGPRMDRFPLAVIDLSLEAIAQLPALFDQFHRGENLILSRSDFLDPAASPVLNAIARVPALVPRVAAFSDICGLRANEMPSLRDFRIGPSPVQVSSPQRSSAGATGRQIYTSPFDVVDGMDYSRAATFVGRPVEMIGQVLKVLDLGDKGLMVLRFGERYNRVPSVAVTRSVFAAWSGSRAVSNRPWISVTGVLQTHRSGKYSTVQVLVKEASDVELLANEDEARYRLGRITRPAPSPPPHQAAPVTSPPGRASTPPGQSSSQLDRWKITREAARGAPGWMHAAGGPANHGNQQQAATASSRTSAPTPRGACPSCGWDDDMPSGAIMLQCSHCGIVTGAERWRPARPAQPSAAGRSSAPSATASPRSPITPAQRPTSPPPTQPGPRQTSAAPSAAHPTGNTGSPWQSTQSTQPGGVPPRGGPPPNSKGLLSRLVGLLFRRSGS
jgi:hypothetical protein